MILLTYIQILKYTTYRQIIMIIMNFINIWIQLSINSYNNILYIIFMNKQNLNDLAILSELKIACYTENDVRAS